jgi:hypothetical protein
MAALAEFEWDLLRERVRSGIAAARKRGVVFGRRPGQRIKADHYAPKVLKLVGEGQSYRETSHRLGLSKNTSSATAPHSFLTMIDHSTPRVHENGDDGMIAQALFFLQGLVACRHTVLRRFGSGGRDAIQY